MKTQLRFLLFLGMMLQLGCGINSTEVVAPPTVATSSGGTSGTSTEVTYSGTVQTILVDTCALCHSSSSPSGGFDATTYASLVEESDVVVAGDPDNSTLIQFLEGGVMPPTGNPAPTDEEIASIRAWVAAGALND